MNSLFDNAGVKHDNLFLTESEGNVIKCAYPLWTQSVFIGAASSNQVRVRGEKVRAHHCEITVGSVNIVLRTFWPEEVKINGEPANEINSVIREGDRISIGNSHFAVQTLDPSMLAEGVLQDDRPTFLERVERHLELEGYSTAMFVLGAIDHWDELMHQVGGERALNALNSALEVMRSFVLKQDILWQSEVFSEVGMFCLILPDVFGREAEPFCEAMIRDVERRCGLADANTASTRITVSMGVGVFGTDSDAKVPAVFAQLQRCLRFAKLTGGNRVCWKYGPELIVLYPPLAGIRRFGLAGSEVNIGSDPVCEIRIDCPTVAPRHALIRLDRPVVTLADFSGMDLGVQVNGKPVKECALKGGDFIQIGEVLLEFVAGDPETWSTGLGTVGPDEKRMMFWGDFRDSLRIGKYTEWAETLSENDLYEILWQLGEIGVRVPEFGGSMGNPERIVWAVQALARVFHKYGNG